MKKCYACGGSVRHMSEGGEVMEEKESGYHEMPFKGEHEDDYSYPEDIVGEIMMDRMKGYSEGGRVANDVGEGQEAGKKPNQFDDLVLRDDLEFSYDGENSGDHIGNEREDEDERDIVKQIMMSRKKKDRMPHPA